MDKTSYENWVKIKTALEESGNTENMFYQRACVIVGGGGDPLDMNFIPDEPQDGTN
tara:strand:- start:1582 stop:1749 length:168 start_codon:yes stop_codon:yes gene_type:complete